MKQFIEPSRLEKTFGQVQYDLEKNFGQTTYDNFYRTVAICLVLYTTWQSRGEHVHVQFTIHQ